MAIQAALAISRKLPVRLVDFGRPPMGWEAEWQLLAFSGLDQARVAHRPRLLSDNGSSYIAGDLAEWLKQKGIDHIRGTPSPPQTQGKIERWHQTLKNRVLLENRCLEEQYGEHRFHLCVFQCEE